MVAISTAQCTHAEASVAGATLACTFPSANTAGNALVAFVGCWRNSSVAASVVNVSDNAGNTWVRISSAQTASNSGWMTGSLFYANGAIGATNTVTSSADLSSTFLSMWIGEITGADSTLALDAALSTAGVSSRQTHNAVTASTASELYVVGISDLAGGSTAYAWSTQAGSSGPAVARPEWGVLNGASFQRIGGMTRAMVSSGTNGFTSSFATTSTSWVSVTAAFWPTQGGGAAARPAPLRSLMGIGF